MRLRDIFRPVLSDDVRYWLRTVHSHRRLVARGRFNLGYCVICERQTMFVWDGVYLRNHYRCVRCWSLPRWRAVIRVLDLCYPRWRVLRIFESSPGGTGSEKLKRECPRYKHVLEPERALSEVTRVLSGWRAAARPKGCCITPTAGASTLAVTTRRPSAARDSSAA